MLSRRLQLTLLGTVALLLLNGIVSYRATRTLIDTNGLVVRSEKVLDSVRSVLSVMKDAETGMRGYLITGNPAFLEPYEDALGKADGELDRLATLAGNNPAQAVRLPPLNAMVAAALGLMKRSVALRTSSGLQAALDDGLLDRSKLAMDAVRRQVAEMRAEEARLLELRSDESRRAAGDAVVTFIIGNLFLFLLLVLIHQLLQRELRTRTHNEAALRAINESLESRVTERTSALADANLDLAAEISVRKGAETQLNATAIELARSNRELQDFAFVASHDLQEPLRKVQAFGDRLRVKHGAALNDEGRDYLARMQNAAGRMHVLINDLLTFSRVTNKAGAFVPVDLAQIAREVIGDLEVVIAQTGARVEAEALPGIEADPLQMRQLLQNLIGNALKFRRPGQAPCVRISAEARGGNCQLSVHDDGIGFDEKYLDRIFTPFQRLHGRGEYEGTGIGLSVCRRIVERHGGRITAVSAPGQGSTFIVSLPFRQESSEAQNQTTGVTQ